MNVSIDIQQLSRYLSTASSGSLFFIEKYHKTKSEFDFVLLFNIIIDTLKLMLADVKKDFRQCNY